MLKRLHGIGLGLGGGFFFFEGREGLFLLLLRLRLAFGGGFGLLFAAAAAAGLRAGTVTGIRGFWVGTFFSRLRLGHDGSERRELGRKEADHELNVGDLSDEEGDWGEW